MTSGTSPSGVVSPAQGARSLPVSGRRDLLAAGTLTALLLLLFGRAIGYGFTRWDDSTFILGNPLLSSLTGRNVREILSPGSIPKEMLYAPVTYLSWLAESAIAGKNPHVMHAGNVVLHLANVLLVYLLLRGLVRERLPAFLGAALFAVHPVQVEPVAWLMGRKDLLSVFFGLLAVLAWRRHLAAEGRRRWGLYAAALAAFVLGVGAKPSLLVLPGVLLLLAWPARRRALPALLPFGAVAVAALAVGGAAGAGGPVGPDVGSRLLCCPRLAWHCVGHLLLVSRPVPFYPWPPPDAWPAALLRGLPLLLAGVAVTVLAIRRRWTRAGPALVAVAILSLPAAGVVFGPRDFITADRYAYLPLVAFAAAAAFGLAALRPGVRWGVSAAVMAGCLALSVPAVGVWADSDAIFARVLAVYPGQRSIRLNRANVLAESGRTREALAEYRRLLDGHEDDVVVLVCLARCQFDAKDYPAAIRIATRIAELEPGNPTHCLRAGYTCRVAGRPDEAVRWDRRALRIAPGDPVAVAELAEILMASDLEALRRDPEDVPALMKVGLFYAREGDRRDAISYLGRAAALPSPQRADCWYFLGRLHYDLGELDRARRALDLALQLAPDHEAARRLRAELR